LSRKKLQPGNYGKETTFEVRNFDTPISLNQYEKLPKNPIYLILDNLRSAFNVGSIFRTADTCRLVQVITCGYTAHPPHAKLDKTALGTLEFVPTRHFDSTLEAISHLQQAGTPVFALETTTQSTIYTEGSYPNPLALVLGNEALGVSREVLEQCDRIVEIPLFGFKNSMNVAAAAAVITFEILRQWKVQPEPGERHGAT